MSCFGRSCCTLVILYPWSPTHIQLHIMIVASTKKPQGYGVTKVAAEVSSWRSTENPQRTPYVVAIRSISCPTQRTRAGFLPGPLHAVTGAVRHLRWLRHDSQQLRAHLRREYFFSGSLARYIVRFFARSCVATDERKKELAFRHFVSALPVVTPWRYLPETCNCVQGEQRSSPDAWLFLCRTTPTNAGGVWACRTPRTRCKHPGGRRDWPFYFLKIRMLS